LVAFVGNPASSRLRHSVTFSACTPRSRADWSGRSNFAAGKCAGDPVSTARESGRAERAAGLGESQELRIWHVPDASRANGADSTRRPDGGGTSLALAFMMAAKGGALAHATAAGKSTQDSWSAGILLEVGMARFRNTGGDLFVPAPPSRLPTSPDLRSPETLSILLRQSLSSDCSFCTSPTASSLVWMAN
jgi:hypothetical protein